MEKRVKDMGKSYDYLFHDVMRAIENNVIKHATSTSPSCLATDIFMLYNFERFVFNVASDYFFEHRHLLALAYGRTC